MFPIAAHPSGPGDGRHPRSCWWTPLIAGLVIALVAAGTYAAENVEKSPATRELLKQEKLLRLARREPADAIRALDRLRAGGSSEVIATAIAEVALAAGRKAPGVEASGLFLCAAAVSRPAAIEQLAGGGGLAVALYGDAVEGLIGALQHARSSALRGAIDEIEGPLARYELSWVDAGPEWTPATHDFELASGMYPKKRHGFEARKGLGTPVVAIRRAEGEESEPQRETGIFETYKYYYALTAVLDLEGEGDGDQPLRAVLRLLDPRLSESHEVAGTDYPLAIDIGAQYAATKQETDIVLKRGGLLKAGKHLSLSGIYLTEPLRHGKIPLVLIHGLSSNPATWSTPVSEFMLDPRIRQGYQVWFFSYSTALAFPYSARVLRDSLTEAMRRLAELGESPANDRVLLVGHSMGGLVTRMQVTDTGMTLWDAIFTEPPGEVDLPAEDIKMMTDVLIVEPLPFVERAVFCATPHRGSKYAAKAVGRLGASLVRVPKEMTSYSQRIWLSAGDIVTDGASRYKGLPDSVQTLRPGDPLLVALDALPIDSRVTYHSLLGDRGRGDTPDSSDGLVPYWSSHLEGAASETIVPSNHSVHHDPEGVEELRRILLLHLEEGTF